MTNCHSIRQWIWKAKTSFHQEWNQEHELQDIQGSNLSYIDIITCILELTLAYKNITIRNVYPCQKITYCGNKERNRRKKLFNIQMVASLKLLIHSQWSKNGFLLLHGVIVAAIVAAIAIFIKCLLVPKISLGTSNIL